MAGLSKEVVSGATAGFALGIACAAAVAAAYSRVKEARRPTKVTHPREWAIWKRLDREGTGFVTRDCIKSLCCRFDSEEHASVLMEVLDPFGRDHVTFEDFVSKFQYVKMMRKAARLKLWHRTCGLGVAGNVAGHMAQAGEASGHAPAQTMPAALFTYYLPPHPYFVSDNQALKGRLDHFPVTHAVIDFPKLPGAMKVQVEPELGLYADIVYSKDRSRVERLVPRRVAAFNDCSIRVLDTASKLSMKKNWGFGSKGISLRSFPVDSIAKGTFVDNLVIISYLKREGTIYQYSVAAPCRNYLCFHDELLDWIVKSINEQSDTDKWEPIFPELRHCDYPSSTWIACGAGSHHRLRRTGISRWSRYGSRRWLF
eukprot:TRINITY_DN14992_c0_g1_i3.p1 TRINITY_DN14992_c0_g1~~TRINITY_DN14992_c0_g1_i3.p1  ORF type:complete len:370 (+),score=46.86 TRINITY_DN14992_c0_g1_i3:38-1147(+)